MQILELLTLLEEQSRTTRNSELVDNSHEVSQVGVTKPTRPTGTTRSRLHQILTILNVGHHVHLHVHDHVSHLHGQLVDPHDHHNVISTH